MQNPPLNARCSGEEESGHGNGEDQAGKNIVPGGEQPKHDAVCAFETAFAKAIARLIRSPSSVESRAAKTIFRSGLDFRAMCSTQFGLVELSHHPIVVRSTHPPLSFFTPLNLPGYSGLLLLSLIH